MSDTEQFSLSLAITAQMDEPPNILTGGIPRGGAACESPDLRPLEEPRHDFPNESLLVRHKKRSVVMEPRDGASAVIWRGRGLLDRHEHAVERRGEELLDGPGGPLVAFLVLGPFGRWGEEGGVVNVRVGGLGEGGSWRWGGVAFARCCCHCFNNGNVSWSGYHYEALRISPSLQSILALQLCWCTISPRMVCIIR